MSFKKRTIQTLVAAMVMSGGALAVSGSAYANDSAELEQLRALVQQLDQKVKVLERKNEITEEDTATAKKETPVVTAGPNGFGLRSADGKSELRLRGQIQVDARGFVNGDGYSSGNSDVTGVTAANTFTLKQFRPIFQGKIGGIYDFLLVPDFGGGKTIVQDAYVDAKFNPWFQVKVGKQKSPFGLERLQGDADGKFLERGLPNVLVPNRDIGAQIHGAFAENTLEYAVGYFNGVVDGSSSDSYTNGDTDNNREKDVVARLFATPFKNDTGILQGLGFGLAGTYSDFRGNRSGGTAAQSSNESNLPSFRNALGQLQVFKYRTAAAGAADGTYADGQRVRWSPQLYYYNGPFGLLTEYVQVDQDVSRIPTTGGKRSDKLKNDAWQVAVSWILTGEDASYGSPNPKNPFNPDTGSWGAWEVVARYGVLDIDNKAFDPFGTGTAAARQGRSYADPRSAVSKASAWTAGLNWYLNRNLKIALDYEQTRYDGGWTDTAGTAFLDRPTDRVLSSRLQIVF